MFQFPLNPTVGQIFAPAAGISYRWNGTAWFLINTQFLLKADADLLYAPLSSKMSPLLNVNPHFLIDQIAEGSLYNIGAVAILTTDGWTAAGVGGGLYSMQIVADPNDAGAKCMELKVTTAIAGAIPADGYNIWTAIEGYDAAVMRSGQASAKKVTVQFALQTNVPGNYTVSFRNGNVNRSYVTTITVPDALEHEYVVTIPCDVTGVWGSTNGVGMLIGLTLLAGSNYITPANAWAAGNFIGAPTQVNFMGVVGNTLRLKRFEIIASDTGQSFTPPDIQRELVRCQRYYEKSFSQGQKPATVTVGGLVFCPCGNGSNPIGNSELVGAVRFKVEKRVTPTMSILSFSALAQNTVSRGDGLDLAANSGTAIWGGTQSITVQNGSGASIVPGLGGFMFHYLANARLT